VKIELPDDHPIAKKIREVTQGNWGDRLFLSLDQLTRNGTAVRLLSYEVDQWSLTRHIEERFEVEFTDPEVRNRQLKAMLEWPEPPS